MKRLSVVQMMFSFIFILLFCYSLTLFQLMSGHDYLVILKAEGMTTEEEKRPFDSTGVTMLGIDERLSLEYVRLLNHAMYEASRNIPFNISILLFSSNIMTIDIDDLTQNIKSEIRDYRGYRIHSYDYMDDRIIIIIVDTARNFESIILFDKMNPELSSIDFEGIENLSTEMNTLEEALNAVIITLIRDIYSYSDYEKTERLALLLAILEEPRVIEHRIRLVINETFRILMYEEDPEVIVHYVTLALEQSWPFEESIELTDSHIAMIIEGVLGERGVGSHELAKGYNRYLYLAIGIFFFAATVVAVVIKSRKNKKIT